MRSKTLVFIWIFLLFFSSTYANWDTKPELRWRQLYRYDLRQNDRYLYTSRFSTTFNYTDTNNKSLFKLTPFYEMERNIRRALWERQELGIEIGKDILAWFYIGETIQGTWLKEDYRLYTKNKTRRPIESETKFLLTTTLLSPADIKIKGFLLAEYIYDFDIGAGTRNEVAAGIIVPLKQYLQTGIDWRHIDRVHDFDSDVIEVSATLVF